MPRLTALPFAVILLAFPTGTARAADQPPDTRVLTGVLRELLLKNMPTPLVETKHDWGQQKEVTVGWTFRKSGPLRWDAEPRKAMKNDGHWHALTLTAKDPQQNLTLELRDVRSPEDGKLTFVAHAACDVDLRFVQQYWKAGARLYSGETRARCRAAVVLTCESTNRFERKPGSVLPTAVVRVRVTDAQLSYDNLVVEHTLGVGGDAAKVIGETAHKLLTRFKPSLERDLLAKANAAVVKAGDTKEVRVGLEQLLGRKVGPAAKK